MALKITILILIISLNVHAQPYLSTGITKGVSVRAGILYEQLDINAGVKYPLTNITNPSIYSLQIGRQLLLTHNEFDNYSLTPSLGIASLKYSVFDEKYNRTYIHETKALYSIELGKDAYLGRVFIKNWYCKQNYLEIGMRVKLYK